MTFGFLSRDCTLLVSRYCKDTKKMNKQALQTMQAFLGCNVYVAIFFSTFYRSFIIEGIRSISLTFKS